MEDMELAQIQLRLLKSLYEKKMCHIGSCLSALDLIIHVYTIKRPEDIFVLSNGHAAQALYAVLGIDENTVHPERCVEKGIYVSTGSLGYGLPIALGMALAKSDRNVYCMISDGECAEGSIWEALMIMEEQCVKNLFVLVNANGWGAYKEIDLEKLRKRLNSFSDKVFFYPTNSYQFPFLKGQDAHYHVMTKEDWGYCEKALCRNTTQQDGT